MTRFVLLFAALVIAVAAPVHAQDTFDPAAYVPADAPAYAEITIDPALNELSIPGIFSLPPNAFEIFSLAYFNDSDSLNALLPLVNERAGLTLREGGYQVAVFGVTDRAAVQAFLDARYPLASETNNTRIYDYQTGMGDMRAVLTDEVLYIGQTDSVNAALQAGGRMNVNPGYARVMRALPAGGLIRLYVSPAELNRVLPVDLLPLTQDWLRLNPAQSAAESGFLAAAGIDGFGVSITQDDAGVTTTRAALKFDAIYDEPAAPSPAANQALAEYIPGDVHAVFASNDAAVIAIPLTLLLTDTITLTTGVSTAGLSIDNFTQGVSLLETYVGASLEELYPLINGAYAAAITVTDQREILPMFWLQTRDADRLFEVVENTSARLWSDPNGTRLIPIARAPIEGFDAITLTNFPEGQRPVLLRLAEDVVALTVDTAVARVIAAVEDSGIQPLLPSDEPLDAVFRLNPELGLTLANTVFGVLDLQADGLVLFELTVVP